MNLSTRRAAAASGLTERQVRAYVEAGLLAPSRGPGGHFRFSFQDVVVLRSGRALVGAGVPARRVRRVMKRLTESPRVTGGLSALRFRAEGRAVLVADSQHIWEPWTGQLRLDLDEGTRGVPRAPAPAIRTEAVPRDADAWFEDALRLEDDDPLSALAAYREAIARDPGHAAAHANLGRLLHEQGDLAAAEGHYRQALLAESDNGTAAYNLGVVLEDRGDPEGALHAYLRALEADDTLAAAHFNAGRLLEAKGRRAEALGHFAAYRKMEERR